MSDETTMTHGTPAGTPKDDQVTDQVIAASIVALEAIAAVAARRTEFRSMNTFQRELMAHSFEQLSKCAWELAIQLREPLREPKGGGK